MLENSNLEQHKECMMDAWFVLAERYKKHTA